MDIKTFGKLTYMAATLALGFGQAALAEVALNQSVALAGGVTLGDTAGFPITISQSGNYVLTGNLDLSNIHSTAIEITAPYGVTIDLNGYNIIGPIICQGQPPSMSCASSFGTASIAGVIGLFGAAGPITVKNGVIQGFSYGVRLTQRSTVEDLKIAHASTAGISVSAYPLIRGNQVANSKEGINTSFGVIKDNILTTIQGSGIYGNGSVISGNQINSVYGTNISGGRPASGNFLYGTMINTVSAGDNVCSTLLC